MSDRMGEIKPHDDRALAHIRELLRDGRPLDDYDAKALLARLDRAEAALATADANLDESQRHNVEVSKLATDWMNAHDSLKAGQPYKLPSPVPVAQLIATADAAGFARGVEAAAGVADEVSGRDDVPLLLRKSIWVAVRKDCASEIAAAIRALVPS